MDYNITVDNFFAQLLAETEKQFKQSHIYQKQLSFGKQWGYSICATPISRGNGVIFGINWGGSNNFSEQTAMPTGDDIGEYLFIKQSKRFLESDWKLDITKKNFNYTNLCFFRTPSEKHLSKDDYNLSLPLFEEYVRYINPPWLLSISMKNFKVLNSLRLLTFIQPFFDNEKKFKGYSAQLWGYKVFFVPHPNAHLTNAARETIWTKVSDEMKRVTKQ